MHGVHGGGLTAAKHKLRVRRSGRDNIDGFIDSLIAGRQLIHQIDVITPSNNQSNNQSNNELNTFGYIVDAPLSNLFDASYINSSIQSNDQSNQLYGLSLATPQSMCNAINIAPAFKQSTKQSNDQSNNQTNEHTLSLRVDRDTHEQLGLTGQKINRLSEWFSINQSIKQSNWQAGNKSYERFMFCVKQSPTPVTMLMMSISRSNNQSINRSTCQALTPPTGCIRFERVDVSKTHWSMDKAWTPTFINQSNDQSNDQSNNQSIDQPIDQPIDVSDVNSVNEFVEWVGLVSLRLNASLEDQSINQSINQSNDTYHASDMLPSINQSTHQSNNQSYGPLSSTRYTGLLAPCHARQLINQSIQTINQTIKQANKQSNNQWSIIHLTVFSDILNIDGVTHRVDSNGNGENDVILLINDDSMISVEMINEADIKH